jgi:catabolite regulation protein CreA
MIGAIGAIGAVVGGTWAGRRIKRAMRSRAARERAGEVEPVLTMMPGAEWIMPAEPEVTACACHVQPARPAIIASSVNLTDGYDFTQRRR